MPKSKVTVDLSELKGKLGKIRSELSKEKVGEHIVDAIVDNIRNNSINPKTGKSYRKLKSSSISIEISII